MPEHAVLRNGGGVIAGGLDQLTAPQQLERGLHSALRKATRVRKQAQTGGDGFPFLARGLP